MPLDFRFNGWEDVIGNKCCFHLVGFKELSLVLGFQRLMDFHQGQGKIRTTDHVAAVAGAVPARWRDEFKLGGATKGNDWREFSIAQIARAYRQWPMMLSKAMMTLIFLELAVEELSQRRRQDGKSPINVDVFQTVKIDPAVYWVDGFDKDFYKNHVSTRADTLRALKDGSGQNRSNVFADIAGRRTCLHATATAIVSTYRSNPNIGNEVKSRVDTGRQRRPASKLEVAVFRGQIPDIA